MNLFKKFRSALSRCLEPKRNKNGSSLAFVVVVGAVLVIWVLCIMPLMTAVGTNGIAMSGTVADYIQSRSAIEFCKSELEKLVETDPPKTFAVIKNGNTYSVAYKRVDGKNVDTTQPTSYGNLINYSGDDKTDTPKDNSVVAICAVVKDPDKSEYNITITTYNDGKPGLTYSTVYTIRGTLKINPESYLKSQALPLSDFVIVDGKLGATTLWNSTIHDLSFDTNETNNVTNLGAITETLLPYSSIYFPGDNYDYADAGLFPAVFKTTVQPAGSESESETTQPTEPDYTDDQWIVPIAVNSSEDATKDGHIWYTVSNNTVTIKMLLNGTESNITNSCTIYYNGITGSLPTKNICQISIDYTGNSNSKVLPVSGLTFEKPYISSSSQTNFENLSAKFETYSEGHIFNKQTYGKITFTGGNSNTMFGYCTNENDIQWSTNRKITKLGKDKTYFFYAYQPASVDENGNYQAGSEVIYLGTNAKPNKYISSLDELISGNQYLIVNSSDYAMYYTGYGKIKSQKIDDIDSFWNKPEDYNNCLWTVTMDGSSYYFTSTRNNQYKYLKQSDSKLELAKDNNKTKFSIIFDGNAAKVYNGNRYLNIKDGDVSADRDSTKKVYFIPKEPSYPKGPEVSAPEVEIKEYKITYRGYDALNSKIASDYGSVTYIRLNAVSNKNPNAGQYILSGNINGTRKLLGILTVEKADYTNLSATPSISCTVYPERSQIHAVANFHDLSGSHWIGYRVAGSSDAYSWFPVDNNNSYTFTLPYGSYEFVARESGSGNYNAAQSIPVLKELKAVEPEKIVTESVMMGSSLYFMGRNGSIQPKGNTIYLYTDLIVLRHDIMGSGSVVINPYSKEDNTYDGTKADTLLFAVNDIKNASGAVVFEALTFYRIPAGTDINEITDAEAVNLHPLNINNDIDKLKLLLRSEDYPEINMDIAYIDRENNEDKSTDNQLAHIVSGETIGWTVDGVLADTTAKLSTTSKNNSKYVVCAYVSRVKNDDIDLMANRVLLAAAETEVNGIKTRKLSVPNSLTFECRYFSVYADLIQQGAARAELVIENLIRDQSDWDRIFEILNLTDYSSKSLQIDFELITTVDNYGSDFNDQTIQAQIYRINEDSWNVFTPFDPKPLTVTYTNDELYELIWNGIDWDNVSIRDIGEIIATLTNISMRVVDRYVSIIPEGRPNLELIAYKNCKIEFYTNYLYIHPDVEGYSFKEFSFWGSKGTADMLINSQERGYESEYLGFFTTNSVETYNGTIICIGRDNEKLPYGYYRDANGELKTNGGITVNGNFIPSGFYFIPATSEANGTSITELTKLEKDPEKKEYYEQPSGVNAKRIDPAELPKYSIYIKQDGTLSDAYVDTGLIGNGDLGESGFSGGNVG